jgi:hypothetical protein
MSGQTLRDLCDAPGTRKLVSSFVAIADLLFDVILLPLGRGATKVQQKCNKSATQHLLRFSTGSPFVNCLHVCMMHVRKMMAL